MLLVLGNPNFARAWFKILVGKLAAFKAVAMVAASIFTLLGVFITVEALATDVGMACLVLIKDAKRRSAIL